MPRKRVQEHRLTPPGADYGTLPFAGWFSWPAGAHLPSGGDWGMASLPLPALPRWVPPVALVAWVGLLAIAAWVRTLGSVWADVTANVVSSAAGVAFAATGVAAALTYWQQRRLQRELAGATVAQLNQATSQVQELSPNSSERCDRPSRR